MEEQPRMNELNQQPDIEILFQTLRFAARQIVAELDFDLLNNHALDMLADFSQSNYLAMLILNDPPDSALITGSLVGGTFSAPQRKVPLTEILKNVIETKRVQFKTITPNEYCLFLDIPIPPNFTRLCCLPLVGTQNNVIGFVTFLIHNEKQLNRVQEESLAVLATMIATKIENVRLFNLATVDGLTGLYVRRYFDIRLQEEIVRLSRIEASLSLVMTDIDHFKIFNDVYGHQTGDRVLKEIAMICRNTARKDLDLPCRFGGEEFALILPGTNLEGAVVFAERLRRRCEAFSLLHEGQELKVTISIGIAATDSSQSHSPEDLIKTADTKLYEAKSAGRNRVRF